MHLDVEPHRTGGFNKVGKRGGHVFAIIHPYLTTTDRAGHGKGHRDSMVVKGLNLSGADWECRDVWSVTAESPGSHLPTISARQTPLRLVRDVRLGLLPEEAYDLQAEDMFRTPYFRELWPLLRSDHSADFAQFMDARFGLTSELSPTFVNVPPGFEGDS